MTVGRTNSSFSPRAYAASIAASARWGVLPHPVDDRVVAALRPVPARVAVHRPVAAADRRDPRVRVRGRESLLEIRDERGAPSGAVCRGRRAGRERGPPARPARAASAASATRWRSLAWTPPGPTRLTMCSRPSPPGRVAARRHASSRAGRCANDPSAIAASIRGRSWSTGLPAPRLRWPTSELPICPGGSPTASSDARSRACGQRSRSARQLGIGVLAIASSAGTAPIPKPSSTTRTIGRGRSPLEPFGPAVTRPGSRRAGRSL